MNQKPEIPDQYGFPPLPSLRALTAELRKLNDDYSHPIAGASNVALCYVRGFDMHCPSGWMCVEVGSLDSLFGDVLARCGCEEVPGAFPFDAVAAARRLLAAASSQWASLPALPTRNRRSKA